MYEKGLAYEAEVNVNYCPALGTVLSNEEVENGKSKEGGYPVERRPLRQWVFKITEYADRLEQDLELLDWPEGLKRLQKNWIGRSVGARVHFSLVQSKEQVSVFTTRPDTLFGATYFVVAPEHPLVDQLTTDAQREEVKAYQKSTRAKSDLDRTELSKEKTGVFTGGYVINPVNGQEIPVWIADYVLMSYGTGAVMAVPAHDERDFDFATKYHLPITPVYDPDVDEHPEYIPEKMTPQQTREAVLAGKLCWPGEGVCFNSSNDDLSLNDLKPREAIQAMTDWLKSKNKGEQSVSYKLRDWLFSRQRYWGEPFPILHLEDGTKRVLELDELPLCPPEINDYKPSGDGQSPLAKVSDWVEVTDPKTGQKAQRETNTMPQWAGSCWYYLRFCDANNDEAAWAPDTESYWMNVDLYIGGVEHAVLHLLYARFWHKVLYDCGLVSTVEPFQKLRNQGLITSRAYQLPNGAYVPHEEVREKDGLFFHIDSEEPLTMQVEKMSKSKLNGVNPDEIIEEYGADSLRLYEMFMGPLEKEKPWNTDAVNGCRRFLKRLFELVQSPTVVDKDSESAIKLGHRLLHGVANDIEALQFNTAIAKMMEFLNDFSKLPEHPRSVLKNAVQALSPFAPHVAEEMWQILGGEGLVCQATWPTIDEAHLKEEETTYVIQVNGKVRARLNMRADSSEEEVVSSAKEDKSVQKHLEDKQIRKIIFVPNRLLNLVVG